MSTARVAEVIVIISMRKTRLWALLENKFELWCTWCTNTFHFKVVVAVVVDSTLVSTLSTIFVHPDGGKSGPAYVGSVQNRVHQARKETKRETNRRKLTSISGICLDHFLLPSSWLELRPLSYLICCLSLFEWSQSWPELGPIQAQNRFSWLALFMSWLNI